MKNIIFFLLGMLIFSGFIPVIQAYIIDEDRVYWENSYGKITVWPHTSYELIEHTQYANITSYLPTQDLDFAFEFDFPVSGDIFLLQGGEWIKKTYLFEHDIYNGKHFYWIKNVNFVQDETKEVKWTYKTPINTSGKWELWSKRSSDILNESLDSGYYIRLDPWWNSSWDYYVNFTGAYHSGSGILSNITIRIEMDTQTPIIAGKMNSTCKDIRLIWNETELDFEFLNLSHSTIGCNTTSTIMFARVPSLTSDTSSQLRNISVYYGNPAVDYGNNTAGAYDDNITQVFHFEGNDNDTIGTADGTITGATYNSTGRIGGGYSFDGTNDYFNTTQQYRFTADTTIMFWFMVTDWTQADGNLYKSRADGPAENWFDWFPPNNADFTIHSTRDIGNDRIQYNVYYMKNPAWIHEVYTYTLSTDNGSSYLNGSYSNSTVNTNFGGLDVQVSSLYFMGHSEGWIGDAAEYLAGQLDEVWIFDVVLTPDEVKRYYEYLGTWGTEESPPTPRNITIISPESITYYNINSILLNVTNITFNVSAWWYSLNNDSNVTFTLNTTLRSIFLGSNILIVYANSTGGDNYSANVTFTLDTACLNSSYVDNTTCSGRDMNYVAVCKQLGQTIFQWDFDNLTFCQYGCFNGVCITPTKTCRDRCQDNQTTCSGNNIVQCVNQSTGCFDWSDENTTFCRLGCIDGECIEGVSLCTYGDSRCQDNRVVWCDDDNGDGFYDWSKFNFTECRFGCVESMNETTGVMNVTCNIHSFDLPYDARNTFTYFGRALNYIFDTLHLQLVFILFMMLVVGGLLGIVTGNWIGGLVGSLFVGFIGLIIWIPALFYVFILIAMIGGLILLLTNR